MGRVMWPAVDEKETAGYAKSIEKTKLVPVFVDIITDDDIKKMADNVKKKDIRKEAAVRIFTQSKEQGGVLTGVDVASMMNMSPATVYKYVREYEQEKNVLVPRRGTIHDMGRTLTHKKEICRKIIVEGKTVEETARLTNHSPEAITRYVKDYKRISSCLAKGLSPEETAFAVKVSENLVYEYQKLIEENDIDLNNIPL
jgi:DNA-binding CsgD family transcriptional regulator